MPLECLKPSERSGRAGKVNMGKKNQVYIWLVEVNMWTLLPPSVLEYHF